MFYSKVLGRAKQFLGKYESENKATYAAAEEAIGGLLIIDGVFGTVNPFGGRRRNGIIGSLIGIIIGIVFIFIPVFFGKVAGTAQMTSTTSAIITSTSQSQTTTPNSNGTNGTTTTCNAVAEYTVNGQRYTQASTISSSSDCALTKGETVTINYNPSKPSAWAYNVKQINTIVGLFRWIGIVIIIMSFITFIIRLLTIIFGWKLLMRGRALAKTLPDGNNLESIISEIKKNFTNELFSLGKGASTPLPNPPVAPPPTSPGPSQPGI